MQIDRESPVPLYYQFKQILLAEIESGVWRPGEALPAEDALQESYGISRTTIRQALGELAHEGRIIRQRGRGTFVTPVQLRLEPDRHLGISEFLRMQGVDLSWKILDQDWQAASEAVAEALGLVVGDAVYRILRLRLADGAPLGVHAVYVPREIAGAISQQGLLASESLRYLRDLPEMANSLAFRTVGAEPAGAEEAAYLGIAAGAPLLVIERITVSEEHRPLEFLRAVYPGDRLRYHVTL